MFRNAIISYIFVFVAILAIPWMATTSIGETPSLDIATYISPSTKWQMEIDPSNQEGSGKGSYRLSAGGKEVWYGELPFTLRDATVTD